MLPDIIKAALLEEEVEIETSKTYRIHIEQNRILGMTDELEAMRQTIYKILNTERYQYLIYSWDYGIELQDLYGQPVPYVMPELENRVKEALLQDDRIIDVNDFMFTAEGNAVRVKFTVQTIFGDIEEEVEVKI